MGSPAWADDRFATATSRRAHRDEIDRGVATWTTTLDASAVFAIVQAVGVPAGIVTNGGHLLGDPQLAHRGYAKVVDQQGVGTMMMEGPAFHGTDIPEPIVTQAPWIGEHTREIARDLLGLSAPEIEQLVADGVLEDPPEVFVPPPPSR
jgi:crotonobetainyl-CoA:carnitine CoA-transferase CaiB-like acyl-CoA transferase